MNEYADDGREVTLRDLFPNMGEGERVVIRDGGIWLVKSESARGSRRDTMSGKQARQKRQQEHEHPGHTFLRQHSLQPSYGYDDPMADVASAIDHAYFNRRPDRAYYVRRQIGGEWDGHERHVGDVDTNGSRYTLVEKIPSGRMRCALPGWWRPETNLVLFVASPNGREGYLAIGADDVDEAL